MKQLKFKHHDSGIKSVICNTDEKWIDYRIEIDWYKEKSTDKPDISKNVLCFYESIDYEKEKLAEVYLDFDHTKYHRFDEQNKNQIIVYFVPREMIL
jgi:hypothetical protein